MNKKAVILLALASFCKGLGKRFAGRDNLPVDALTMPGWFVMGDTLGRIARGECKGIKDCIEWDQYRMPDQYIEDMRKLKGK